jgi:hypothetical protein
MENSLGPVKHSGKENLLFHRLVVRGGNQM